MNTLTVADFLKLATTVKYKDGQNQNDAELAQGLEAARSCDNCPTIV